MIKLLLSAIGLSATDCLDPVALSVAIYLLTTANPILNLLFFVVGVVLVTFVSGLSLSFGLIKEIDTLFSHPHGLYFSVQLLIGVALIYGGYRYYKHTAQAKAIESPIKMEVNPPMALFIGMAFTATDLPTNVPLLAVADALVKSNAHFITIILSCLAYSLVRVSPSLLLLLVFILKRDASSTVIAAIQGPIMKWGHRIMAVIICGMGLVLALDSFYYFITDKALLVF